MGKRKREKKYLILVPVKVSTSLPGERTYKGWLTNDDSFPPIFNKSRASKASNWLAQTFHTVVNFTTPVRSSI